jgi:hypothetical protein
MTVFVFIGLIIGDFICGVLAFILYRLLGDECIDSDSLGVLMLFGYIMLPVTIIFILYERLKRFIDFF